VRFPPANRSGFNPTSVEPPSAAVRLTPPKPQALIGKAHEAPGILLVTPEQTGKGALPLITLLLATSCVLTLWFATVAFIPYIWLSDLGIGFDAYRYHYFAQRNFQYSLFEILAGTDMLAFDQTGYPILLSLLYGVTTPDPLVGCMFNWALWVVAGLLLVPLARPESDSSSTLPFLALWLLYPESFQWNGMTTKEPLVAFAVACAIRGCSSRARIWTQTVIVAVLSSLMFTVRQVAIPLLVLALAVSFEFRDPATRKVWSRYLLIALVAVLVLYMAGATPNEEGEVENPLARAGYSATLDSSDGLSTSSLLRRMGSPDRLLDSLWAPVRGASHLICPLYYNPFRMSDISSQLEWLSAAVCSIMALAVLLRLLSGQPRTRSWTILLGVLVLGLLALGFSGILHPRYRSLIVAALLPLGLRSFREEVAERGPRRLLMYGVTLPGFILLLYRFLR
jgi:hypothetical protein